MIRSMTAYGRASVVSSIGRLTVEIQSVNRKHLEINSFLPKELMRYDPEIKKWVSAEVGRGQVNVKVYAIFDKKAPFALIPNISLAKQLKEGWQAIAHELEIPLDSAMLLQLLSQEEKIMLCYEELDNEEEYRNALGEAVTLALKQLMAMKESEGAFLQQDMVDRFKNVKEAIQQVALKAPGATLRYRDRLIERLKEVAGGDAELDERILREVGIYAEKIDIAEELTRFESHLQQVDELLISTQEPSGKTMEFLLQEMNREINTIGSKSSDVEVAHLVVKIKGELERVREQVQNIE